MSATVQTNVTVTPRLVVFLRRSPWLPRSRWRGGHALFCPIAAEVCFHRLLARPRTPWGPEVIMRSQCPLGLLWQGCTLAALRF